MFLFGKKQPKDIKAYKEMVCDNYNLPPEKFSKMDYYWDNLGLMASTHEQKTVHLFWIKLGDARKYPAKMAKYNFSGTLLINGRPWQEVVEETGVLFPKGQHQWAASWSFYKRRISV